MELSCYGKYSSAGDRGAKFTFFVTPVIWVGPQSLFDAFVWAGILGSCFSYTRLRKKLYHKSSRGARKTRWLGEAEKNRALNLSGIGVGVAAFSRLFSAKRWSS
jgi:hypothetical protein